MSHIDLIIDSHIFFFMDAKYASCVFLCMELMLNIPGREIFFLNAHAHPVRPCFGDITPTGQARLLLWRPC